MGSYEQILAGTSLTVTETFSVDGSAIDVDSGTPVLVVTKPDGTAYTPLPTVQTTWTGRTTGQYRFVLPAQQTPYYLNYTLTGTIGGQAQTLRGRIEWVGSFLFNIYDLRTYPLPGSGSAPFSDTVRYPNAKIQKARTAVLDTFTRCLGFSPVRRYAYESPSPNPGGMVILKKPYPADLLSVSVAGVAQTVTNYYIGDGGVLLPVSNYQASPWTRYGYGVIAVGYTHGWDAFEDEEGRNAALDLAAAKLNPAGFSTAQTVSLPTGESYSYEPAEVGRMGYQRFTGIRSVDRWLNLNRQAGVAVA